MMKKLSTFLLVMVATLFIGAGKSQAGTWFTGAKGWYAAWDSAILDWLEEDLGYLFLSQGRQTMTVQKSDGEGYLAGPMLGYQTDDGNWSYSFAPMVFSNFSQDWAGSSGPMVLNTTVDLERHDFDFAASRKINNYFKYYIGYKYQDMSMDFRQSFSAGMGTTTFDIKVESQVHIPTVGINGVFQLNENLVVGGQVGVLYTIPSMELIENGVSVDMRPWSGLGFNAEGSVTWRPWQKWLLQAGYRYQSFEFEARRPGTVNNIKSYDITHGATLTAVYLF